MRADHSDLPSFFLLKPEAEAVGDAPGSSPRVVGTRKKKTRACVHSHATRFRLQDRATKKGRPRGSPLNGVLTALRVGISDIATGDDHRRRLALSSRSLAPASLASRPRKPPLGGTGERRTRTLRRTVLLAIRHSFHECWHDPRPARRRTLPKHGTRGGKTIQVCLCFRDSPIRLFVAPLHDSP